MSRTQSTLALFLSCRRALVNYAATITGDRARAEDVVQDAYLRLHPGQGEAQVREPQAYLYRVVRNLSLDHNRSQSREQQRNLCPPQWLLREEESDPAEQCERLDDLASLERALADLPPATRRALEMHRLRDCTLAQIAAELEVSQATAHRLVRDGLLRLARALPVAGEVVDD